MFYKTNVYLLVLINLIYAQDNRIFVQLRPEQILSTFKTVVASDYIQELANEFAKKAADHLISEIKNTEKQMQLQSNVQPEAPRPVPPIEPQIKLIENNYRSPIDEAPHESAVSTHSGVLDEARAHALLQEPSPDGDNLDVDEELSREEEEAIPVVGVMKINGVYYRRFLGLL